MHARSVEELEGRLVGMRQDERQELALSGVALGASLAATVLYPPLALPLFVGGVVVGVLGIRALWRRWDLVDRLADDRDAYVLADVLAYAARDATTERRHSSAELIRSWLRTEHGCDARIAAAAVELAALADDLDDRALELDPACAVACRRLLRDYDVSPLFSSALPPEDVQASIARIRAGFTPRRPS
jgi:hypothetical protein